MNNIVISSQELEKYLNLVTNPNSNTRFISGRITNQCSEPIDGVTIKIVSETLEPITHTLSNVDGEYTVFFSALSNIKMIVSKKEYISVNTGVISGDTQNFMLFSEPSDSSIVKGKILYTDCKPAMNLRVRLSSADFNESTFSSCDGSFLFAKVPSGRYIVTVDGNDCVKKTLCVTIDACREYTQIPDVLVERKNIGGTLHGIVTDCLGKPVENAVIILFNQTTKAIISHTTSNKDGIYFFGNLSIGNYYVEAYK